MRIELTTEFQQALADAQACPSPATSRTSSPPTCWWSCCSRPTGEDRSFKRTSRGAGAAMGSEAWCQPASNTAARALVATRASAAQSRRAPGDSKGKETGAIAAPTGGSRPSAFARCGVCASRDEMTPTPFRQQTGGCDDVLAAFRTTRRQSRAMRVPGEDAVRAQRVLEVLEAVLAQALNVGIRAGPDLFDRFGAGDDLVPVLRTPASRPQTRCEVTSVPASPWPAASLPLRRRHSRRFPGPSAAG